MRVTRGWGREDRAFKVRRGWWEREGQGLQGKDGKDRALRVTRGWGREDRAFKVRRGWWEREGQGLQGKEGVVGMGRTGP